MIYTAGYLDLRSPQRLAELLDDLEIARIVDVRARPSSRVRGWSRSALELAFPGRYEWRGDVMGGLPRSQQHAGAQLPPIPPGVLRTVEDGTLLLCACAAPGDCHRHRTIALPLARLGVEVTHVFGDELIVATELERSIVEDTDYACWRMATV